MFSSSAFRFSLPRWAWLCCAGWALLHSAGQAQEFGAQPAVQPSWPLSGASPLPKTHEAKPEKPSAVVQKHYRCQGGKALSVRYQLGARSIHAFAKLQGKVRELPWDGDYKLEHEEDERFSDGQYEIVVQGNFSRVTSVRRLPSKSAAKAGSKGRELLRACVLPKAQLQVQAQAAARLEKKLEKVAEKSKAEQPMPAVPSSANAGANPSLNPNSGTSTSTSNTSATPELGHATPRPAAP